ncbi:MAG: GNAT family N-acetyltransferase [Deltaproteobacteria bacterium]|jgi:GNAT superfamily N-acetyltransferase|nr:GNAT family N-acetyltransferase [Deltaproteobacteria bacterium]
MHGAIAATVRPISVAEAFASREFSALCREYAAECAIAGLPDPKEKLSAYLALEAGGSDVFHAYGAFLGDMLIGFAVLLTPVLPHYGTAIAVAESLFVGSAHRKTGAGMLLIRQAEKRAREVRSPGMLFSAPSGGRLAVLLPRIGYRETNRVFLKEFAHD